MAKNSICEFCGRYGPTELRFGIQYCPDCTAAIRTKNISYFETVGKGKATKRALDDLASSVLIENDVHEYRANIQRGKKALEMAGGYWEYKVVSLYDKDNGTIDVPKLETTINNLGIEGWRLTCAFANELGHNTNSTGIFGVTTGTNATIDQSILIFERFVSL